jgi:septal ring factor EnvC (AmiA/AmiB activator)
VFFFSRKEAKALVPLRGSVVKSTRSYYLPQKTVSKLIGTVFFFSRKEAKALVPLRGSVVDSTRPY